MVRDTVRLVENQRNIRIFNITLIFIVILELLIAIFLFASKQNQTQHGDVGNISQKKDGKINVFYEKIPGSKFHGPDATWWGYNQNKIVRFGNFVFMYVIENTDDKNTTTSDFVIYKKEGDRRWEKGAIFKTSRPGNILIDSKGVLHAFVFEPFNVVKNDSWGKLKHYYFPNSQKGNIFEFKEETVIDNNGAFETVNIRVGSAIGADDTIAIGFGLTTFNPLYKGHSMHLYTKKPDDLKWTHHIAGENLGHDWYYPFVWVGNGTFHLLPVQDDYNGPGTPGLPYSNIYQKIMYFEYKSGLWNKELISDLSSHPLAKSRPRLLEQEELYKDTNGSIHILYKELLDEEKSWEVSTHKYLIKNTSGAKTENLNICQKTTNWIRIFEVNNKLYYLCVFFDSVAIAEAGKNKLINLEIPKDAKGFYPYIATRRGGTRNQEEFIDILLLAADSQTFTKGENFNYYVRIPKKELGQL